MIGLGTSATKTITQIEILSQTAILGRVRQCNFLFLANRKVKEGRKVKQEQGNCLTLKKVLPVLVCSSIDSFAIVHIFSFAARHVVDQRNMIHSHQTKRPLKF